MDQGWGANGLGWLAAALALALAAWLWRQRHRAATPAATADAPDPADPVTGLRRREHFEQALEEAARHCDRDHGTLAMIYLDLDNFRLINDAYGHAVGDRLLAQVAGRLRATLPGLVALTRNAADEFMLVLPGGRNEALQAALQMRGELRKPYRIGGRELLLDASIGIALYPEHGAHTQLQALAVAAMRSVKQVGGGAHTLFEAEMDVDMRQQAELLHDLRNAVSVGALRLVFQPKIDARSLQVTAAEALLRWHDAARGVVSPTVFVPLAEKNGLIRDIGRWAIEEACRQAGLWRAQGLRMRVAVNLSGYQMRQDDLVDHLCACLRRHGIPPSRFTCEITESVAMEDTRVTNEAFERLRQAGVHVSIDDFGTGHSSLATLRKLPAAELKIDRAFVTDLSTSADARAIAGAIVQMAHMIGLRVVAEGVETEAQRDLLVQMGCDELQGFLFAKPMSAMALAIWARGERGPSALGFRESLFHETRQQELTSPRPATGVQRHDPP